MKTREIKKEIRLNMAFLLLNYYKIANLDSILTSTVYILAHIRSFPDFAIASQIFGFISVIES